VPSSSPVNPFLYLQANADSNPNGLFSVSPTARVSNAEAVVEAKKIAYELRRLGVRPGDIVVLDLPDPLSILFTEAVYHEGAISTVLPEGYSADGVLEIAWVFSNRTLRAQGAATIVMVDARFLQEIDHNPYGIRPSEEPIETLRIVFSSGTTGTPKAIALGREMERIMDAALPMMAAAGTALELMDTGIAGGIGEFFLSVKAGVPYLTASGASPSVVVSLITDHSVRRLGGSPAQVAAVVAELERTGATAPSIQSITVGGSHMPAGLVARAQAVTEGCVVMSNYGSTEAGTAARRVHTSEDPFDAGQVVPGSTIEIVDAAGQVLPVGEIGRIRHRGSGMAHEYVGNPEATSRAFRGGWFYPGDLGLLRPDGGLTLAGRESEVLNSGGVKIDPNRIDSLALQHPQVIDACSFEYAAESGLREIGLALVTEDGIDVEALVATLTAELGHAAPTLVARVDTIPRTATGKPVRRTLAERYSNV